MAAITYRAGKWQIRIRHKLLPKPFFYTFATEPEARAYAQQLETMLDRGIVPVELIEATDKRGDNPMLSRVIDQYAAGAPVAPTERDTLRLLQTEVGAVRLLSVTAAWADSWIAGLKTQHHLAPGTIRKRVGALARAIDWHWRRVTPSANQAPANALRLLPRGYSQYTATETAALTRVGLAAKRDTERDRRLSDAEVGAVRAALAGQARHDRERSLPTDPAFALLFELLLATGMRLSEAYRLRVDQVDLQRWVIGVEGSKGHRGAVKPRTVPLLQSIRPALQSWCKDRVGLVFPFWDGTPEDKARATWRLSHRFTTLFDYAGVPDCTEHDLRHTATCSWFLLRGTDGRWLFSEVEVCRIMGWSSTKMAIRYASFRAEDLSARLG